MNTIRTIGTGIAWNTLGSIAGRVVVFLNIFLILGHLSVYEYGLSELVFSVVATLSIVLLPGLSTAIVADLALARAGKEFGKMKAVLLQFFLLNLALSVIAWAVLFFGSSPAAELAGNPSIGHFIRIVSFTFLVSPFRMLATMLATVELRFLDQSFYSVVEELCKCVALAVAFLVLHRGIDGLLYAAVASQVFAVLLFIPRTFSAYRLMGDAPPERAGAVWDIVRFHRKWSIGSSYLSSLTQTAQIWIIRLMLGTEAVGLYAFASGLVSQLSSLLPMGTILSPLVPRYVERRAELARIIKTSAKLQFALSILFIAVGIVGLPILAFIFPKYLPAVPLAQLLLLTLPFSGVAGVFMPAFAALREQFSFVLSAGLKLGLTLALYPLAIFLWGIWGIGIASVLVFVLTVIERSWRFNRLVPEFALSLRDFYTLSIEERGYVDLLLARVRARFLPRP